jgi:hypothetical protein
MLHYVTDIVTDIVTNFVRGVTPTHYWSAGFMAWLLLVAIASFLLFVITHWRGWLVAMFAALVYFIPFAMGVQ